MKTFILSLVALLAVSSVTAQYTNQTAPFHLKLCAPGTDIDGTYLYACHSGAAIEQACLGNKTLPGNSEFGTYYLNYSDFSFVNGHEAGILVWNLPFNGGPDGEPQYAPSTLSFFYSPTSNVATMAFLPSTDNNVPIGFDENNKMFLYTYIDDTVFPPNVTGVPKQWYHFQACRTYFTGYQYDALAWVTTGQPINPSCQAVEVVREPAV